MTSPRKTTTTTIEPAEPPAPGPIQLEARINGRIKFLQRVHSYTIDQQDDRVIITGWLTPGNH